MPDCRNIDWRTALRTMADHCVHHFLLDKVKSGITPCGLHRCLHSLSRHPRRNDQTPRTWRRTLVETFQVGVLYDETVVVYSTSAGQPKRLQKPITSSTAAVPGTRRIRRRPRGPSRTRQGRRRLLRHTFPYPAPIAFDYQSSLVPLHPHQAQAFEFGEATTQSVVGRVGPRHLFRCSRSRLTYDMQRPLLLLSQPA